MIESTYSNPDKIARINTKMNDLSQNDESHTPLISN